MLVKDIMQRDVACIQPETSLEEVVRLLQRRGVRHLPVVDREALVGIVSDRDVKSLLPALVRATAGAEPAERPSEVTAADILTKRVITVEPATLVEDAARLMMEERIGALPVTERGALVGIVTETDVLQLFVRAMGILEPSSRLDVLLPEGPSSLCRLVHVAESAGAAISSIVTLTNPSLRLREAVIRVSTINPGPTIRALEAEGFAVRSPKRAARC